MTYGVLATTNDHHEIYLVLSTANESTFSTSYPVPVMLSEDADIDRGDCIGEGDVTTAAAVAGNGDTGCRECAVAGGSSLSILPRRWHSIWSSIIRRTSTNSVNCSRKSYLSGILHSVAYLQSFSTGIIEIKGRDFASAMAALYVV